jgi:hypothetical protein
MTTIAPDQRVLLISLNKRDERKSTASDCSCTSPEISDEACLLASSHTEPPKQRITNYGTSAINAWFVADWRLQLPGMLHGRLAIVIDMSAQAHILHVWFRNEAQLDPAWVSHVLHDLTVHHDSPHLIVTSQERLYPTIFVSGARMNPVAKAILDLSSTHVEPVNRCTRNLMYTRDALSHSSCGQVDIDLRFQAWKVHVNTFGFFAPVGTLD